MDRFSSQDTLKEALKSVAQNDPDAKYLEKNLAEDGDKEESRESEIRGLVQKYMIEPCDSFTSELEPGMFIQDRQGARNGHKIDKSAFDYYQAWARFIICQALTSNDGNVVHAVTNSVKSEL